MTLFSFVVQQLNEAFVEVDKRVGLGALGSIISRESRLEAFLKRGGNLALFLSLSLSPATSPSK